MGGWEDKEWIGGIRTEQCTAIPEAAMNIAWYLTCHSD